MLTVKRGLLPDTAELHSDHSVSLPCVKGSRINRILVIEDDDVLREAVLSVLGVAIPAYGAATGREALQILTKLSPTIVLLNLQLLDMDGLSVLEQVRQRLPGARVVVTSDSGDYNLVLRVTNIGVGDFLEKPYSTRDLFNSLGNSVRGVSQHLDYWTLVDRSSQRSRLRRQALLVHA